MFQFRCRVTPKVVASMSQTHCVLAWKKHDSRMFTQMSGQGLCEEFWDTTGFWLLIQDTTGWTVEPAERVCVLCATFPRLRMGLDEDLWAVQIVQSPMMCLLRAKAFEVFIHPGRFAKPQASVLPLFLACGGKALLKNVQSQVQRRPVSVSDGPSCCWMVVGWLVAVSRHV